VADGPRQEQHGRGRRGAGAGDRQGDVQDLPRDDEGRQASAFFSGSLSVNTAPPPSRSVTSTVPPWSSAIRATIARPKPEPPGFEEKNGRKIFSRSAGATPAPRSPTDSLTSRGPRVPRGRPRREGRGGRTVSPPPRCAAGSRWRAAGGARSRRPPRRGRRP